MSRLGLWNPAKKSDKAGVTWDKAERLNMSRLGLNMKACEAAEEKKRKRAMP
jgi:hypothetical protein